MQDNAPIPPVDPLAADELTTFLDSVFSTTYGLDAGRLVSMWPRLRATFRAQVAELTTLRTRARAAVAEYDRWLHSETNRRVTDQPDSAHYALMQLLDTLDTKGR
jgi:hypothetical protein